jgi:hypothetical protein
MQILYKSVTLRYDPMGHLVYRTYGHVLPLMTLFIYI